MKTIFIEGHCPYSIDIGHGLFPGCIERWPGTHRTVVIADSNVAYHYAPFLDHLLGLLDAVYIPFPGGERYKTRAYKQKIEDDLLNTGCGRDTCLIALGGGVTSDLVGFVGATYCRGIPVIYVPTTLLAMVDASIGGKTGVNTPYGKNLIGAFYSPQAVTMDVGFLSTLPEVHFRAGLVELIKHALIHDAALFLDLEMHIPEQFDTDRLIDMIARSCSIKKTIVMQDEHDQSIRQWLNFGHTIGHALERASHYRVYHGKAVACGIVCASKISTRLGLLSETEFERIYALFRRLKMWMPLGRYTDQILSALAFDKKTVRGQPRLVLLQKIGLPYHENGMYSCEVPIALIQESLQLK